MSKLYLTSIAFLLCLPFAKTQELKMIELHGYKQVYKKGFLFEVTNDSLALVNRADKFDLKKSDPTNFRQYTNYAFTDIRRIRIKGKLEIKPIVVGAAIGTGTGIISGFLIEVWDCAYWGGCPEGTDIDKGTMVGAITGMTTGALIGLLISSNKRKHQDLLINGKITDKQKAHLRQTSVLVE